MFLLERFYSLLLYSTALFAFLIMIRTTSNTKFCTHIYVIVLCIFAYLYEPHVTADLYRLKEYTETWVHFDWGEVLDYAINIHNSPCWVLYSYSVEKFLSKRFLSVISCLWGFENIFHIVNCEIKRNHINRENAVYLFFYIMAIGSIYIQLISGIRSLLSITIFALAFYGIYIEEKQIIYYIPLVLFALFLHPIGLSLAVILFLSYLLYALVKNKNILLTLSFVILLLCLFFFGSDKLMSSYDTGLDYLSNDEEYSFFWESLIGYFESVQIGIIVYIYYKHNVYMISSKGDKMLAYMCFILMIICLFVLPFSYAIFRRTLIFSTLLSVPVLSRVVYNEQVNKSKIVIMYLFYISVIIFIISISRGDLCGYKFFVLE